MTARRVTALKQGYNSRMAEPAFKAFVSCSFAQEDRALVEFFKRLAAALNFSITMYERIEVQNLTVSVEDLIKSSDCVIAIATKRSKIAEGEDWTTSDWIHQEVAFARAYAKPIALFVERGVHISGFIEGEIRKVVFSRENLLESVDTSIGYLYSLRRTLDEALGARNRLRQITFSRESVRIRESFTEARLNFTCDILMEALENVPYVYHSSVLEDDSPGLTIHPESFEFRWSLRPPEVDVSSAIVQDTQRRHVL